MKKVITFCCLAFATFCLTSRSAKGSTFTDLQKCHVKNTVDNSCMQKNLAKFEAFVLSDNASWFEKSIAARALVTYYNHSAAASAMADNVRYKYSVYAEAISALSNYERMRLDEDQDLDYPDRGLKFAGCPKDLYLIIKNYLVKTDPDKFKIEIAHFDKDIKSAKSAC